MGWQALFVATGLAVVWWYLFGFDVVIIAVLVMAARVLSALLYLMAGNAQLGLSHWRFFRSVLVVGAMPYLFGYGLMLAVEPYLNMLNGNRWLLIAALAGLGVFYLLLTGSFFYAFMCNKGEQAQIRQKLRIKSS
jgi:hypothetical protein